MSEAENLTKTGRSDAGWGPMLWLRSALWPGLICGPLIVFLVLHRAGMVGRVKKLAYERTLILNLLLYWLIATLILAAWRRRQDVARLLRSQAPQIGLAVFSMTISFAFAEVALRILRPHAAAQPFERLASETLHHRNAPDRRSLGMGGKWVETNEDGFRTSHSRESFLQLEHRVALLGDSFPFGLGVDVDDGVAAVLEAGLRERLGDSVGVLNTGVISYSPYLERQAFREVVKAYEPTLTLLLVDANDIGDDYQYERENVSEDPDRPRFDVPPEDDSGPSLCERSAICRALGPVWTKLSRPLHVTRGVLGWEKEGYDYYAFEAMVGETKETNRFFILRHPLDATRSYFDRSWQHIEATRADVEAAGSTFALVVMPRYFHWDDTECPDNWESDRYGPDEPHENAFLEYFDEKVVAGDLPILSLLPAFQEHDRESDAPAVFKHDPHWNEVGHRVAGDALASWLIDQGWPAQGPRIEASVASVASFPADEPAAEPSSGGDETGADGAGTDGAEADRIEAEATSQESSDE